MKGVDPGLVKVDRSRQCHGKDLSPAGHDDDNDENYVENCDYEDDNDDGNGDDDDDGRDGDEEDDVTKPL